MLIRLECTNHGRTPAKLIRFWWDVRPFQALPKIPPYPTDKKEWFDGGMYVAPDKLFTTRAQRVYSMEWTDRHAAFGRIDYEDVFGKPHSYGFILRVVKNKAGTDFSHPPLREDGYEKYWDES